MAFEGRDGLWHAICNMPCHYGYCLKSHSQYEPTRTPSYTQRSHSMYDLRSIPTTALLTELFARHDEAIFVGQPSHGLTDVRTKLKPRTTFHQTILRMLANIHAKVRGLQAV